jgi:hypothetical protein
VLTVSSGPIFDTLWLVIAGLQTMVGSLWLATILVNTLMIPCREAVPYST